MNDTADYFAINRNLWNAWTGHHVKSAFYNVDAVRKGADTLKEIELDLIGDIEGLRLLHLQCHFGLDSISLARRGAQVTGLDISPAAILNARELSRDMGLDMDWVCANVFDTLQHVQAGSFDLVFTTYGTIIWLPDLKPWAEAIAGALKQGGRLVFCEFHPVLMMLNEQTLQLHYDYFNRGPVVETAVGSYADRSQTTAHPSVTWNHSLADVLSALLEAGLRLRVFREYDFSPFDCFPGLTETSPGRFQLKGREGILPIVFSLLAEKE